MQFGTADVDLAVGSVALWPTPRSRLPREAPVVLSVGWRINQLCRAIESIAEAGLQSQLESC